MAVAHRVCFAAVFLFALLLPGCETRIHKLTLKNETRHTIDLNNFGFYANATLDVHLSSLRIQESLVDFVKYPVGFSLSRSRVNGVLSYTAEESETCPLTLKKSTNDEPLILFLIDTKKQSVNVSVIGAQDNILMAKEKHEADKGQKKVKRAAADSSNSKKEKTALPQAPAANQSDGKSVQNPKAEADNVEGTFDLSKKKQLTLELGNIDGTYNFSFHMVFGSKAEGLYSLKFHYCQNREPGIDRPYSFTVEVTEKNPGAYLSAAEIPLSRLYLCMAGVFFAAAVVWVYNLMKHSYSVFKIHWLMAALAFTKSTSLFFHSVNYHFINTEGHPIEGWAVMYYITHLLKGALLFITLALIGTGWAFVKYILSDKEKKIFMIVIPLQVLANVAYIIIESTEEGSSEYYVWKEILFLVDLICCGAILFPVVWSIRHLQEASSTDGKAAMNLEKLKLFRHYYVMIVCYIYFTRIIAILLKITMPFQWQWCYEFLVEVSTLIFFVLTGYKFRPASNNPYLQLPQDEDDVENDEVVTESGALEGISKVKKTSNGREHQKESTL
ncbi:protein GPR108 [Archocentrus centrarchus]|uniref:protein GPR108 n=1 Tax=Archocentrus centrarchus TaxID=63155 RepID=UPI0011EA300E|nr:protein GPR108 [Archocentrus centrarchus]